MSDSSPSPPPRRGFPSAFAPRPVRTDGGASGESVAPEALANDEPSPSSTSPSVVRRGFPSAFAARAVAAARPLSPASLPLPLSRSPSPPRRYYASSSYSSRSPSPDVYYEEEEEENEDERAETPSPPPYAHSAFAPRTVSLAVAATRAAPISPDSASGPVVMCPYLTSSEVGEYGGRHVIPPGEFHLHILECRERYFDFNPDTVDMARCRYNGAHYIPAPELQMHERLCRDDRRIQIEEEMKTEPTPIAVYESDDETSDSDDDDSGEDIPERREQGGEEQKKGTGKNEEEVVGDEEYGRVVHDLVDI